MERTKTTPGRRYRIRECVNYDVCHDDHLYTVTVSVRRFGLWVPIWRRRCPIVEQAICGYNLRCAEEIVEKLNEPECK